MSPEEHKAEVRRLERAMFDANAEMVLLPDDGSRYDAYLRARDVWRRAVRERDLDAEYGRMK